jgi:hypothetical protein
VHYHEMDSYVEIVKEDSLRARMMNIRWERVEKGGEWSCLRERRRVSGQLTSWSRAKRTVRWAAWWSIRDSEKRAQIKNKRGGENMRKRSLKDIDRMVLKVRESAYSSLMVNPRFWYYRKGGVCDDKKNKKFGRRGHNDRESEDRCD